MNEASAGVPHRNSAINVFYWAAPTLFLIGLWWDGLQCWFIGDDFAWLGLSRQLHQGVNLLSLLFSPAAQGTIRPWSERGFFLLFEHLFGLDALPFRIMVFATMAANLALLQWLTRRITGSPAAGCLASIVWSANTGLMVVMTWSSAYNQVLCAMFLLSAMALFIRYAETGRTVFWWLQLLVFVLGFGALEINVVYPALALSWALFSNPRERRRHLSLTVVPLAVISVAYFFIHQAFVPLAKSGVYVLRFDARIFQTATLYGKWSLLPLDWSAFGHSRRLGMLIVGAELTGLALLFLSELKRKRSNLLFFACWYVVTLAPVLALPDHLTDYYLTIPLAGFAILVAWGACSAWQAGRVWQIGAGVVILAYLTGMIPVSRSATNWALQRSQRVQGLVLGVAAARQTHPGKTILIDGVTQDLFRDAVGVGAFYVLGADSVYLTPGSDRNLQGGEGLGEVSQAVLDPTVALHAIAEDQVVIYSFAGDHLRNITEAYERSAPNRLIDPSAGGSRFPGRIDVGNPLYSWLLSPSWLSSESGVRWMPGKATVRLKGPQPGNKLLLEGYCPEEQLKQAGRHLIVSAGGIRLGETQISAPETTFRRLFDIPPSLVGRDEVEIEIRVSPVTRRNGLEYGVLFGRIELLL